MADKRLWVDELQPGMRLAAPIMLRGVVLVNEKSIVTKKMIEQLKMHAEILTVLVEAEILKRPLSPWERAVRQTYEETVDKIKNVFTATRETKQVPMNDIVELTSYTVSNLLTQDFVLHSLKNLNSHDEYTYHHSVNVGVLCGVLGKWLKYDDDMLFSLVLSGVLHDIGKSQIPLEVLNKPGKLTADEMAIMRMHTVYGYDMIKDIYSIPNMVKAAALQHHEKIDGTGYPFGSRESEIGDFAKIVAVADTYDAVTSNRVYQKARSPFSVIEIFEEEMFIRLDSKICLPMLAKIKNTLIGRQVITDDGRRAKIIFIGQQANDDMILQTEDGEFISLGMKDYKYFKDYLA
ncbi:MAG: HD-GYP domain-containing protein [Acidaminococcales bacterium]|nr:HD-GYP domain-containing protein [Acidaminococcales bacterium]